MQFLTLHIHLERSSRSLKLQIPVQSLKLIPWIRKIIYFGLALLILQLGSTLIYDYLVEAAANQQLSLYNELDQFQNKINSIQSQLKQTFRHEDLVHYKFGLTPPHIDEKLMGIGGDIPLDSSFQFSIYPTKEKAHIIHNNLATFKLQIERSRESYRELSDLMQEKYGQYRHIPSVSPASGRFSSGYGMRIHPVTGERKMHAGIDISNQQWTPLFATADGVVTLVKYQDYFGNYIVINHGNGLETKYGHMIKFMVKEGQKIKRYDIVGYMGRTGRTTGIHIHYEVWKDGDVTNPMQYILSPESMVD